MTAADELIYRAFIYAPYNGFQSGLSIAHAARECGVTRDRVADAIHAINPDLPPDAFRRPEVWKP